MIDEKTIRSALPLALSGIEIDELGKRIQGKVRDIYIREGERIVVTTDRLSAFDRVLGLVPFKGAVLNQLSQFWFEETLDIVPNHMLRVPDPNVMVVRDLEPIPVEIIVRGYISGVTKTALWTSYAKGDREIYGISFPDGLVKNQKLPEAVITPTTHAAPGQHDERLTREEIIEKGIVEKGLYEEVEKAALALFANGTARCESQGLILVDTKYEFGLHQGKLMLMDEVHTPDSSRFWLKESYAHRLAGSEEPENFDKEFLRLFYNDLGYQGDGEPPAMPDDLRVAVCQRYIEVFEMITGTTFTEFSYPIDDRIRKNVVKNAKA